MRMTRTITIASLTISLLAGTAVGVAAQEEEPAAVSTSFTGRFTTHAEELPIGSGEQVDSDGLETGSFAYRGSMVSSDPRLTGTFIFNSNDVEDIRSGRNPDNFVTNKLTAAIYQLTNDEGSWLGEATGFANVELDIGSSMIIFTGQGGYDGLTAYALLDWSVWPAEYVGTIFPKPMPEMPEPYVAE